MKRLLLKIQPLTAFGSKINGGMLFGQFCCTIKMLCGEKRLQSLLDGYCDNKPFAIFSDALPQGLVPMPTLPFTMWVPAESSAAERKRWKKMRWLACAALDYSPDRWHEFAQPHSETDGTRAAVAHFGIPELHFVVNQADVSPLYVDAQVLHFPLLHQFLIEGIT